MMNGLSECIFVFFFVKTVMRVDIVREFVELVRVGKEINRSNIGSCSSGRERRYFAIII